MYDPEKDTRIRQMKNIVADLEHRKQVTDAVSKDLKRYLSNLRTVQMPNELVGIFRKYTDGLVKDFSHYAAELNQNLNDAREQLRRLMGQ